MLIPSPNAGDVILLSVRSRRIIAVRIRERPGERTSIARHGRKAQWVERVNVLAVQVSSWVLKDGCSRRESGR